MEFIVANLAQHFNSLRRTGETTIHPGEAVDFDAAPLQQTAPPRQVKLANTEFVHSPFASYNRKMMKTASGISYGQPQFFSPVYTPINWQIPSRRREVYMWCRYWYENEPRLATAIDLYSRFPITGFETECKDRYVKHYFDELNKKLDLDRWLRIISHEVHLLGDCYPFLEVDCPHCGGSGRVGSSICEHPGGSFKRILIMNPDFIEVFTNPLAPENIITYLPDDELRDLVLKGRPGSERLSADVKQMVAQGQPIPLDNLSISHLKYGESGYRRYGISMIRRLFPILSYKTKIMTAQWIVAERMIIPVKVVKVGSDDRPASDNDIAAVQAQLMASSNDPNLCIVTHHAFDLEWYGAAGKILQVSGEYEFINQEILDGMGLNKQLITGEGPTYSSAAMGAEIMIRRFDSWRQELKRWVERQVYLPIAKMKGFVEENEWGEPEYIYPKIKWDSLNLRDRQAERQMILNLYEKGLVSARTTLQEFDIDPDAEFEQLRYERIEQAYMAQPGMIQGGGAGGMGGEMGGGLGDLGMGGGGGGLELGGSMGEGMPGGEMGGAPGGEMGGMPGGEMGGGAPGGGGLGLPAASQQSVRTAQSVDPGQYGGKVLTQKTREKLDKQRQKVEKQNEKDKRHSGGGTAGSAPGDEGFQRDERGRVFLTGIEKTLLQGVEQRQRAGDIRYNCYPSLEVAVGDTQPVVIDLAFPDLRVAVECDGEKWHGSPEDKARDEKRDAKLNRLGWIVLRFGEKEIERNTSAVLDRVAQTIRQREAHFLQERQKMQSKREQQAQK